MLLEQGKAADALAAFEATLRKEPNRLNGFLAAAAAASAAGDSAKARQYFSAAAQQASDASVERAEVIKARAFLASAN
jgi:Tfp pilus assembly protein PilF